MEDSIEREKLNSVIGAVLNRLTEKQCTGVLSELDTAEVNYIIENNDEWVSKRILRELITRRIDAVDMEEAVPKHIKERETTIGGEGRFPVTLLELDEGDIPAEFENDDEAIQKAIQSIDWELDEDGLLTKVMDRMRDGLMDTYWTVLREAINELLEDRIVKYEKEKKGER